MTPPAPARGPARRGRTPRSRSALVALAGALVVAALPAVASAAPARAAEVGAADATSTTTTDSATAATATDSAGGDGAAEATPSGPRELRRGDRGPDVVALQRMLEVRATGVFNRATKRAVRRVQRAAGLEPTGVVDAVTMRAIERFARDHRAVRSMPRSQAPAASKRYARRYIASRHGWDATQFSCLRAMWERESNWRYWVSNPNGRYHGIPQTSSAVWRASGFSTAQYMRNAEVQVKVGVRYIRGRYGTPCRAWSFWRSHHWY